MGRRPIAFDPTFKNRGRGKKRGTISMVEPLQNLTGSLTFYNPPQVGEGEYLIVSDSHTAKEIAEGSATPIFWVVNNDNIVETVNGLPNNVITVYTKAEALSYLAVQGYLVISSETSNVASEGLVLELNAKNDLSFIDNKPTSNLLETGTNWSYIGTTITDPNSYPVPLPSNVKFYTGGSNGAISWTDACRNYVDSYPAGTKITVSGWHMFYSTDTSLTMNSRTRLGWHYNKDGVSTYGGTIYTATAWNTWTYFSHTFSSTGTTTNLRVEDGGYDYYLSSEDAAKTTQYYCNLQIEIGDGTVSPYVKGTREQNTVWRDMSGGSSDETWYTLYGLTYPESSQTPSNRDGITPGYNVTSGTKTYDCSRDLNYFVFDEDTNTWVADSYFNGERISGHCYDTYDGQPNQHQKFQDDFDAISGSFPNATHIVIGSHAAENNDNNSGTLERLQMLGLPKSHIGVSRPEYILVGKIDKPYTHRYVRENVSSAVAKMNLSLPLEGNNNATLVNGPTFKDGAITFDGTNDYAIINSNSSFNVNTRTVELTFKMNGSYSNFAPLAVYANGSSSTNRVWLGLQSSKFRMHGWGTSDPEATTTIDADRWYTCVWSYDKGTQKMKMYTNGVLENDHSQTQGGVNGASGMNWYLAYMPGGSSWQGQTYANVSFNSFKIYDRVLSDGEVSQNYYNGPIVTNNLTFAVDAGNLVSYESGSTTVYSMTGSIEGTLINGTAYTGSNSGTWTFDNSDDKITFPNNAVFNHTSELTIESWARFDGNSNDFIFEKGNVNTQYSLFSHGSDIVFRTYHAGDGGYDTLSPSKTTAGITNGQWHHIVGSWDGSTKRIYVDGILKSSKSKSGALTTTSQGAAIGAFGGTSSGYYFGGEIAIVRIYSKGLSASEVGQNYNAQRSRFGL